MQSDQPRDMAISRTAGLEPPHLALWKFLRARQNQIVVDWAQRMRSLSPAHDLSDAAIVDHLPQIVGRIADLIESMHTGKTVSPGDLPKDRAVDRLGRGFDLDHFERNRRATWRPPVGRERCRDWGDVLFHPAAGLNTPPTLAASPMPGRSTQNSRNVVLLCGLCVRS